MKRSLLLLIAAGVFSAGAAGTDLSKKGDANDSLRERAGADDRNAQVELAHAFFFGKGRKANPTLAAYWYRRAALNGSPEGMYNYAACLEHGWGVEKSRQRAFSFYSDAADKGYIPALTRKALMLYTGIAREEWEAVMLPAIPPSPAEALQMMRKASNAGYAPAKLALALKLCSDRESIEKHAAEIARLAKAAAGTLEAGEEALLLYARCLEEGIGTIASPRQAAKVLEEAIKRGSTAALVRLGRMLEFGFGIAPDPPRALELYRQAAERGNPEGMTLLADKMLSGTLLETDTVAAFELYTKAAAKNFAPAHGRCGDCLLNGWGTPANPAAAFDAYEAGARGGDINSQYKLGRLFADGRGVQPDPAAAVFWYKSAASGGSKEALRELGIMLINGRGVPADIEEGIKLLETAAKAGDSGAAEELKRYNKR